MISPLVLLLVGAAYARCDRAALSTAIRVEIGAELAEAGPCIENVRTARCSLASTRASCTLDVAASPCAEDLEQNLADALADVARVVSGSACAAEGLSLRIARGADPSSWSIDLEDAVAAAPRCTEEWLEALDEVSELQRDHGCDVTSEIHCKAAARPGVLKSDAARLSLVCAQPARARIAAARVPKARLRSACRLDALLRSLEQRVAVLLDELEQQRHCRGVDVVLVRLDRVVERVGGGSGEAAQRRLDSLAREVHQRELAADVAVSIASEVWIARVRGTGAAGVGSAAEAAAGNDFEIICSD